MWLAGVESIAEESLVLILIDDCFRIESFVEGCADSEVAVSIWNSIVLVLPLVACSLVFITPTLVVDTLGETLLVLLLVVCSSVCITPTCTLVDDTVGETLLVVEVLPR